MRVAIYARVSTVAEEKGQDPKNQLIHLREAAAIQGWTIVQEYVDRATGRNGERPQFQAMLQAAARRKFDLLLFWSLDRLSREGAVKTILYLEQLARAGVKYRSHTEPYLDTTAIWGEMLALLLATLAKFESQRMGERVRAGQARARAEGVHCGRPAVKLSPRRLATMRRLRAEGLSFSAIAKRCRLSRSMVWSRLAAKA